MNISLESRFNTIDALSCYEQEGRYTILADIALPENFPFECPIRRANSGCTARYLDKKAEWIAEALLRYIGFEVTNTPEHVKALQLHRLAAGRISNGLDADSFSMAVYDKKDGMLLVRLNVSDWLQMGGGNWYLDGTFFDESIPGALHAQLKPEPVVDGLEAIEFLRIANDDIQGLI